MGIALERWDDWPASGWSAAQHKGDACAEGNAHERGGKEVVLLLRAITGANGRGG
jgi:hypothetical protein